MMMRTCPMSIFLLFAVFFLSSLSVSVSAQEICDDGSLNTTSCNPCSKQENIEKCQAISTFHQCSATQCDGACSFECQCRVSCDNCAAACKPNYCMVEGKKINNNMPYIDGCKRCICKNGVTTCSKPDPKCVEPKCPRRKKFEQVCEDKCATIRVKCEADMIPCQIDQCNACEVRTCQPRPCATMHDCDAVLGQICYFANRFDRSIAGVCRTFEQCNKRGQCAPGSTPDTSETNKKCYCIPNQVSSYALELDQQRREVPPTSEATITSASTLVALVTAASAAAML